MPKHWIDFKHHVLKCSEELRLTILGNFQCEPKFLVSYEKITATRFLCKKLGSVRNTKSFLV